MPGKKVSPRDLPEPEGGYRDFKIGDLFIVKSPKKKFNANDVVFSGRYPYIARGSSNNGIRGFVDLDPEFLNEANSLSFGQDTATIFYQKEPYFTGDKIKILILRKNEMDSLTACYLIAAMRKAFQGFLWGVTSFSEDVIDSTRFVLPCDASGNPDFEFMRERVRELKEERVRELKEERVRELKTYLEVSGFENCTLTKQEVEVVRLIETNQIQMKKMRIVNDVFSVKNSHNILKSDVVFGSGNVPYVTASEGNNSIVSYISYSDDEKEEGNTILIGGKTLVITYQPQAFFSNDSHNLVLRVLDEVAREEDIQLYLVASLYKSLSHKYTWGNSISKQKIQSDTIYLPVSENGTIDYQLMKTYIRAVKKECIARLKTEISREQEAYRAVINE